MCKNIEEMAIEARRSYQREWRRKNPDKVRENSAKPIRCSNRRKVSRRRDNGAACSETVRGSEIV